MMRVLAAGAVLALGGCSAAAATGFQDGLAAYRQNRVAEAERAFAAVAADSALKAEDRAGSNRELARIAWLVDGDAARAEDRLKAALQVGVQQCETNAMVARVLRESRQVEAAVARGTSLLAACNDPVEADSIRLHLIGAHLDLAAAGRVERLGAASELWTALAEETRTSLPGARARLEMALMRGEAAAAFEAWRSYFWLSEEQAPQAVAAFAPDAAAVFTGGLAVGAEARARLELVDLLIRAGFSREARRFAFSHDLPREAAASAGWRKAAAYWAFRHRIEADTLKAYRNIARGRKQSSLAPAVKQATAALLSEIGASGDSDQVLLRGYGLHGTVGETGGFPSVHLGHATEDRRQPIQQYGHAADVRFIVLDNMLSNGFESWLWDGYAAAGGWTSAGPVIVQVRPEYTSGPLRSWRLFGDTPDRERLSKRRAELARGDAERLRSTGVAYLPGVADRLRLQIADQIGARVSAQTGGSADLRRAFLAEAWRASVDQSILVHEGRHALDRKLVRGLGRLNDKNLEHRAKLSELALADYPRLALSNINESGIGGPAPHSRANADILKRYADWIDTHREQVQAYDPATPPLAQIDKLTDAQIRSIARSLDPLARSR